MVVGAPTFSLRHPTPRGKPTQSSLPQQNRTVFNPHGVRFGVLRVVIFKSMTSFSNYPIRVASSSAGGQPSILRSVHFGALFGTARAAPEHSKTTISQIFTRRAHRFLKTGY